jgi:hypothetical protein
MLVPENSMLSAGFKFGMELVAWNTTGLPMRNLFHCILTPPLYADPK